MRQTSCSPTHLTAAHHTDTPAAAAAAGGGSAFKQQQQQLPASVVVALSGLCEALTQKYRGMRLSVGQVHWVVEEQFSTVQGTQVPMQLAAL